MPLTDVQLKAQVLIDIQDDGTVSPILDLLWTKNDNRTLWQQYLYTRLDAVNVMIAKSTGLIQVSGDGRSMALQQAFDHLILLRNMFISELNSYTDYTNPPEVSEMEAVAPIEGNVGYPDPNDTIFLGDPTAIQAWWLHNIPRDLLP
jgi:hypothetical protein